MKKEIKISFLLSLSLLMYWACTKNTVTPDVTPESVAITVEEKAVQKLRLDCNAAIVQKDSIKIASFCTTDYTLITSRSSEGKSPDFSRFAFNSEFTNKLNVVYERIPDKIRVYENWKMAAETGHWTGSWTEPDGKVQLEGSYYAKWHKINGEWKMRVEVFTPGDCKGSAACDKRPF
jgi:ketosteroid isomerase-like protein